MSKQINFKTRYVKLPGYSTFPLHGVYGGVGGSGLIAMHIYSEAPSLPESSMITVNVDDASRVISSDEQTDISGETERAVSATYVLDAAMAKSLIGWLEQRVSELEAATSRSAH